jgi:hypothetical protein
MPLTLTLTEGALPAGQEKVAVSRLTEAMLKWHGLSASETMRSGITATVHLLPRGATFSGGKELTGVWVEWRTPSFAFLSNDIQRGFFADAADIIHDLSGGKQPKEHIYFNVVHAVDGAWGFQGRAMTNAELGAAVAAG